MREHYQVNEIFSSVQGEGMLVGTPSTFIRLQGCTVGCPWCDTKYTWMKGGKRQSVDEIAEAVHGFGNPHVVITGGEPTLYDLDPLLKVLNAMERNTQLETSGQQWLKGHITPNWITLSPKESLGWRFPFGYAKFASEVKWVVDGVLTFERVMTVWNWMRNDVGPNNLKGFVLMPEGCPPKPENIAITLDWLERVPYTAKMYWRYGDRIQYRIGVR